MSFETIALYLCGNIQKGHELGSDEGWSNQDRVNLEKALHPIQVNFLDPSIRKDDLSDQKAVFGRDLSQVFISDIVLVDAKQKRGVGVGSEMMWAKIHKIPVVTLAPHESHYRKSAACILGEMVTSWTHPFIESLSDCVVNDLEAAAEWIKEYTSGNVPHIKDYKYLQEAMCHYKSSRLSDDTPMLSSLAMQASLQEKVDLIGT